MSFEKDFLNMTADQVTVIPPSTVNSYGAISYSSSNGIAYDARIEEEPHSVLNGQGIEVIASGTVFVMSSSAAIGLSHQVELDNGLTPELLRVDTLRDEQGQHHVEVHFR